MYRPISLPSEQSKHVSVDHLRATFDLYDKDRSGSIDAKELRMALAKLGMNLNEVEVGLLLDSVDTDHNGTLEFAEFLQLFDSANLRILFRSFDEDGNGRISLAELRTMFRKMGWRITDHQVEDMMKRADLDGDGSIDVNEFCLFFERVPSKLADVSNISKLWLMPPSRIERLREVFDEIDTDQSGNLDWKELQAVFKKLGVNLEEAEVKEVIQVVKRTARPDTTAARGLPKPDEFKVDFMEFLCTFDLGRLKNLFNEIDVDESGSVTLAELKIAMHRVGWKPSEEQLENLMKVADSNGDGEIDFEEFCKFFELTPVTDIGTMCKMRLRYSEVDVGSSFVPVPPASPYTGEGHHLTTKYSVAAAIAALISRSSTNPLERIKILKQALGPVGPPQSAMSIARTIIQKEGFAGLWRGTVPTVLRLTPFAAFVGAANGYILRHVPDQRDPKWRLIAIASAASIASAATYPLDMIRTRMCNIQDPNYATTSKAFRTVLKHEGIQGLYRGLMPTLWALPAYIAIQQTTYEVLKEEAMQHWGPELATAPQIGIGIAAGIIAQTITFPLDVVRVRMQMAIKASVTQPAANQTASTTANQPYQYNYKSTYDGLRSIVRASGPRGLFAGLSMAYMRVIPNSSISLTVRDYAMQAYDKVFVHNQDKRTV